MSTSDAFANLPKLFRQLCTVPAGDKRRSLVLQSFATIEAEPTPFEAAPIEDSTAEDAIVVDAIAKATTEEDATPEVATAGHAPIKDDIPQKLLTDQYVLILVDTHTHPFSFDLGTGPRCLTVEQCRGRIHAAVKDYCTRWNIPFKHDCRVVVRAFAFLATDADNKRTESVLRFAVRFSAANPFFDFILAPDHKCVKSKITQAISVAAKDKNCMQIFVAAWYGPSYTALLNQQNGKTTLLEGEAMNAKHSDFDQDSWPARFGLFSFIFRSSREDDVLESRRVSSPVTDSTGSVDGMVRKPDSGVTFKLTSNQTDSSTHTGSMHNPRETLPGEKINQQARIVGRLPTYKDAVAGHVPVNKDGERVDFFIQKQSKAEVDKFDQVHRSGKPWPCRWYHLVGKCWFEGSCQFSHAALSIKELAVFRYHAKLTACHGGSRCRKLHCPYGHICQKWECSCANPRPCSLKQFHIVDPKVAKWVPASD